MSRYMTGIIILPGLCFEFRHTFPQKRMLLTIERN